MSGPDSRVTSRPRRPLFQKYFIALFVAVVVPLLANGASEAWFGYRDQRVVLSERLRAEARMTAGRIQGFLDDIANQLQWTVQLPWREGTDEVLDAKSCTAEKNDCSAGDKPEFGSASRLSI